jgi:dTMP kinase
VLPASATSGAPAATGLPAVGSPATGADPTPPPIGAADPGDALGSTEGLKGVLAIGDFRRVWYATALSSLGDWLGLLATTALAASLATSYEGENYALGLVLVVRLLPSVLLGPLAGAFADRFDRRHTMVVSDLLRFVLFMTIPLSLKLHIGNDHKLLVLYVASFLVECVSLFWNPAKDASVPNLVGREHVEAANQLGLITTYGLTPVAAAGLFSGLTLLTDRFSASASTDHPDQVLLSLYFNAATFVVAAAVIYTVRSISGSRERKADADQPGLFAMLGEGVTFMSSSKLLRGVIVGILGAFAAGGGVIGAGHTYVTSLGGGNAAYGVLFGAVFVGLGLGMAVAPKITKRLPRRLVFGLGIVLAGVCLVLTSLAPHVILAMIVVVGVGFGGGVSFLSGLTLLGTEISDDMRGRVFAFIQSLVRVVLILSLAAVPFIVGRVGQPSLAFIGAHVVIDGTRIVLALGGVLAILAGLSAYRLMGEARPVRYVRRGGAEATNGPGLLIAFEGGEGSGKSTQINALAESLRADGVNVDVTFEPGATPAGSRIRAIVLESRDDDLDDRAEALLFAADRANHVATVIRPALEQGLVVLTDRFVDSSLAYQGAGRSLSVEDVRRLSKWATGDLVPDLTVVLDIPVTDGLARAARRSAADRLEQESTAFHQRVRDAFRSYADSSPERYLVVDARLPREDVLARVRAAVDEVLDSAGIPHAATDAIVPEDSNDRAGASAVRPDASGAPSDVNDGADASDARPDGSGARPDASGLRPADVNDGADASEARPDASGARR